MKGSVELLTANEIACLKGECRLGDSRRQSTDHPFMLVCPHSNGPSLEQAAQVADLSQIFGRQVEYEGAAARPNNDQSLRLQLQYRLAHWSAADAKFGGEILVGHSLAETQSADND